MENSEDGKSVKPEKSSSPRSPPPLDQSNVHVYPDWAAMQAYYGHRVAVPPYFNSSIPSGQAPHPYMWGPPQPMMPPYGVPYIYAHGGVYAHPGVPLAAGPLSMDAPPKSPGTADGLMKKLKGFDGLAMSIGNGNADSNDGVTDPGLSQSGGTEGSSDGSDGNSKGAVQNGRKRSHEEKQYTNGEVKTDAHSNLTPSGPANNEKVIGATVGIANARVTGKAVGKGASPSVTSSLEPKDSPNAKITPANVQPTSNGTTNDSWLHNERELKRERRKQSNRESARRSRLRKQAEAEELAIKVDSLTAENVTLRSEINRFKENSEKLKNENAKLMEILSNAQSGQIIEAGRHKIDEKKSPQLSTANLLSRVNNAGSADRDEGEGDVYEKTAKSGAKLHQLLDASPRTDAVAAG